MIGEDVEVTVIEVRGEQVRLGVKAPGDVAVHRKEIYLQVQEETRAAAGVAVGDVPDAAARR